MQRTNGSLQCGGCTREAAWTPWSTLNSSGGIIANMRRRVTRLFPVLTLSLSTEWVARLTCLCHKQGINVHLAKKMIEDRSRDYMNARRVAKVSYWAVFQMRTGLFFLCVCVKVILIFILFIFFCTVSIIQEYETVMKGLDRNAPSVPPQNSPQEAQQVEMWKKYIQWEKSNPLRTEDQTLITKRGNWSYNVDPSLFCVCLRGPVIPLIMLLSHLGNDVGFEPTRVHF